MIKINFLQNLDLENIIKTKNWLYKKFESSFKTSQNTNLSEPHSRKRESWIWWILRIIIIVHKYILRILGRCVRSLWWYTTLHAYHIPGYICIFVFSSLLLAPPLHFFLICFNPNEIWNNKNDFRFYLFTLSNIPFHVELYPVCGETPSPV